MADYPGPFCEENGITTTHLKKAETLKPSLNVLKNGLVLEINTFLEKNGDNCTVLFNVLCQINPAFKVTTAKYIKTKVSRTCDQKKKLVSKKKVPGVKNLKELLNAEFKAPVVQSASQNNLNLENTQTDANLESTRSRLESISVSENFNKSQNLLNYEVEKFEKHSKKLENEIAAHKKTLNEIENRIGHYSVRNVNKRDETAKRNIHMLRDSQRLSRKQETVITKSAIELKTCKEENKTLSNDIAKLREKINLMKKEIKTLTDEVTSEKRKKLSAQKYNSYIRGEMKTLRDKCKDKTSSSDLEKKCTDCKENLTLLSASENEVLELKENIANLQSEKLKTKNDDGSYTNEVRLCIMELAGLEVAVEKVSPVIRTISKHLFKENIDKKDLPSSTTTQCIIDEGHYLAKSYISHKLSETENWGLHRDGTTRRKQKLLDTSVSLASGETISLGFNRVSHETAVMINNVTKDHISELATLNSNINSTDSEDYIKSSLERLSYTMSDRAANEKKADALLDEWRSDVLKHTESYEQVHHFHCMAHVLLGFHNYICASDLKKHENDLLEEHGPLGCDALPVFKYWSKKGTVLERVLRTTSEVFGPSGDHHGVRDAWEAYCAEYGIESVIGNYKDNRFNALFQPAAEVYLHRDDFIKVLQSVKSNNLLLQSVLADLQSEPIITEVQCLGLFYIKLTGPYWNVVVNNKVPYLQLYKEVQTIHSYLQELEVNPAHIFEDVPLCEKDALKVPYHDLLKQKLENISEESRYRELLLETVKMTSKAMTRTVEKQLSDFLTGGKFAQEPEEKQLQLTSFAPVTNLACEHHFGHLDSSQRKRPGASLYHHTSVQLLKQSGTPMMKWIAKFPDKEKLLKSARLGGKRMREKHQEQDRRVLSDINEERILNKQKKDNKKRKAEVNLQNRDKSVCLDEQEERYSDAEEEVKLLELIPTEKSVCINEYVAIAYQDSWYPGVVVEVKNQEIFVVKFMTPTRKLGQYKWPLREDRQTVQKQFLISVGFVPDCLNSGRLWNVKEAQAIENIYKKYSLIYFKD